MGKAAYFIRLFGCPVHCPWCDSAGTWHPDYVPDQIDRFTPEELASFARESRAEFVVVTGGEPAIHDLTELADALHAAGLSTHLETSGAFPIRGAFDWITVSPKWQKLPLDENLAKASEFKLIVEDSKSIDKWIQQIGACFGKAPVWLHPEWSQRDNPAVLESITNTVKRLGAPFRAGYQIHKLYRADLLDPNSQPSAPLGGDESKGF